jgi:hypothetical protein
LFAVVSGRSSVVSQSILLNAHPETAVGKSGEIWRSLEKSDLPVVFKKKIFRTCPGGTPASNPAIHGWEKTKQAARPSGTPTAQASKIQASRWDKRGKSFS